MVDSPCSAVILLLCGLPAAGKTTLAKELVASSSVPSRAVERLSFDDLYETTDSDPFDPGKWNACQQEMVERVRRRVEQWTAHPRAQKFVLLVDDNLQYRSLRKRFFHVSNDLDCGFGILYVNVPASTCHDRNAARTAARVPEDVFRRMQAAFEAPDGRKAAWETNTRGYCGDKDNLSNIVDELLKQGDRERLDRRFQQTERQINAEQRSRDQVNTRRNIHHLVDLKLRAWIAMQMRVEGNLPLGVTKAQYALELNKRRKLYLASLTSTMACFQFDEQDTPERMAVWLVERFQREQR